jgi:subtilisin
LNVGAAQTHGSAALPAQAAQRSIVVMASSATPSQVGALVSGCGAVPDFTYDVALKGFAASLTPAQLAKVQADPLVKYVEPDAVLTTCAETMPWGVNAVTPTSTPTGTGIGVAIIDTGINLAHPDLAGNIVSGVNFVKAGAAPEDDNGHGTHVAGTVAAVLGNGIGYSGVAAQAKVIPVKVLNRQGSGTLAAINAGINWVASNAAAKNIKVANMSLSGSGYMQSMHDAIAGATAQGVTFVAAGNNGVIGELQAVGFRRYRDHSIGAEQQQHLRLLQQLGQRGGPHRTRYKRAVALEEQGLQDHQRDLHGLPACGRCGCALHQ